MTTELEQEFFKVFGIEPKRNCYWSNISCKDCNEDCVNFYTKPKYPKITDHKLLEMICIMNKHIHKHNEESLCPIAGESRNEIKNYMLRLLNFNQPLLEKIFIKEIQQLFKEEE